MIREKPSKGAGQRESDLGAEYNFRHVKGGISYETGLSRDGRIHTVNRLFHKWKNTRMILCLAVWRAAFYSLMVFLYTNMSCKHR